jgi:hypothetical protein
MEARFGEKGGLNEFSSVDPFVVTAGWGWKVSVTIPSSGCILLGLAIINQAA